MTELRSCRRLLTGAALAVLLLSAGAARGAASRAGELAKKPDAWFASDEAKRAAANVLSWQADLGGWPKNEDTTARPYAGDRQDLKPTFDNGATTGELALLARMYGAAKDDQFKRAFERGVDYVLKAQYPTGGWPQFYPPGKQYHRHITFNDDAMVRLMLFLRDAYTSDRYAFLDDGRKKSAREAFDRGVQCILQCQIKVDGKPTAWCAQHDEVDYSPRPGRAFELTSLSGFESVGITRLLMSLENPSPEVVRAVEAAVAWFDSAKLAGIKVVEVDDKEAPNGKDKRVVDDPAAPPMWARFYDIGTNRPIFCDRDGVVKNKLSEIGYERRNGYAWLGYRPQPLLEKEYPAWKKKWAGKLYRAADVTAEPPAAAGPATRPTTGPAGKRVKIVLAGDSTVNDGGGWGRGLKRHLAGGAECVNWAQNGRSSKSFINEGWWAKALSDKPDYVLIQFGHNDQPGKGPERETDPATTYPQWMARYVDEARAAGAKPVLVTSLARRVFKGGKVESSLTPYADAVKKLAAEKDVPLIDLHARSIELLDRIGPEAAAEFDPKPAKADAQPDRTHLSPKGAEAFGQIVADELKKAVPELAPHVR